MCYYILVYRCQYNQIIDDTIYNIIIPYQNICIPTGGSLLELYTGKPRTDTYRIVCVYDICLECPIYIW